MEEIKERIKQAGSLEALATWNLGIAERAGMPSGSDERQTEQPSSDAPEPIKTKPSNPQAKTLGVALDLSKPGDYIQCVSTINPNCFTIGRRYVVHQCCYESKHVMTDERLPWYDSTETKFILV